MAEHHRLSFAPVFVIDRRAVFGRDHRHRIHFLSVCVPLPSAYFFINDDPGVTDWSRSLNSYQPETTSFLLMIQVVLNAFLDWQRHNRRLVSQFTNPEGQF